DVRSLVHELTRKGQTQFVFPPTSGIVPAPTNIEDWEMGSNQKTVRPTAPNVPPDLPSRSDSTSVVSTDAVKETISTAANRTGESSVSEESGIDQSEVRALVAEGNRLCDAGDALAGLPKLRQAVAASAHLSSGLQFEATLAAFNRE